MKQTVIALLAACGDPGGASDPIATPISCDRERGAEVIGELDMPDGSLQFGPVGVQMVPRLGEQPQALRITDDNATLWFYFDYTNNLPAIGEHENGAALYVGSDFISQSGSGTLLVDANVWPEDATQPRCFAGRFEQTFSDRGTLVGWFRVP